MAETNDQPQKRKPTWKTGADANPNGRPKGTGKPISHLRRTLTKLRAMEEQALKNIEDSIKKKDIDKEALATSKWLITTMVTLNRAATADEQLTFNMRVYREEKEESKAEGTTGNVVRFRTKMVEDEE